MALVYLTSITVQAQLSPGDLSAPHTELEGLQNCTTCHTSGNQISQAQCLDCHQILENRIDQNLGLHANEGYKYCIDCHTEHHGREFELIYWKAGIEQFDHDLTGYSLEGEHAKLECRDCHEPSKIIDLVTFEAQEKNLERTFLGLEQPCLSCHVGEHRGQLEEDCLQCHSFTEWTSAPKFDHDNADYKLTGAHLDLDCVSCHEPQYDKPIGEDLTYTRYSEIAFAQCSDCHEDSHKGRFGNDCMSCHNTTSWENAKLEDFDHDNTRYSLRGEHVDLACEQCHQPGKPHRGVAFDHCTDCHYEVHKDQFASRAQQGACDECHSVEGFNPSSFTVADHQETDFPLEGGHLAIPCIACHESEEPAVYNNRMLRINHFTFESTNCQDCHTDVHDGETTQFTKNDGCMHCHTAETWRSITFDHNQTEFELRGAHQSLDCIECHEPTIAQNTATQFLFSTVGADCQDCHTDIHQGQFAQRGVQIGTVAKTECSNCHTEDNWDPTRFDHNRDSQFILDGAHADVACEQCHQTITQNGLELTLFKPIEFECRDCHGGS